jgi:hypothetical protein
MDEVIRLIAGPARTMARSDGRLKRWFFLRYFDRRGPHLRLRLHGSAEFCAAMREQMASLIARTLPCLGSVQRTPLIPFNGSDWSIPQGQPGYSLATYEPEYEKYGGPEGVAIAEKLFEASSELALQAISRPATDWALLGLRMMELLVCAAHPEPNAEQRFLDHYFWYWSGQDRPAASDLRMRLESLARQHNAQWRRQLSAVENDPPIKTMLDDYRGAIAATLSRLAANDIPVSAARLCFDYLHVHNNRLGISPHEESWLAALLLQTTAIKAA